MSLYLCIAAFVICLICSRHSLVTGLVALLTVGYAYGIVRANLPETYSHFIFDAGVLGFYVAQLLPRLSRAEEYIIQPVKHWLELLIGWPLLLFLIPNQDLLIRFVGLRANIFLLPFVIIGARLTNSGKYDLAVRLAILNIVVFGVAAIEYFVGIEQFFPRNEVTRLIYLSKDVMGNSAYRIPSTFTGAHAYAGTMVMSLPLLLGALHHKKTQAFHKPLLVIAVVVSLLGVFMAATRLHFIAAAVVMTVTLFSLRSRAGYLMGLVLILAGIGWVVSSEERLQRFTNLQNTEMVSERVAGSVNMGFFDLATAYPFGNGLGGGGTNIPYFLSGRIERPVGMENEYARILLEQGLIGLGLWLTFIAWLLTRRSIHHSDPWFLGRRLAWVICATYFATGLIGTGLLTSIPQTCVFLLSVGWVARQREEVPEEAHLLAGNTSWYSDRYQHPQPITSSPVPERVKGLIQPFENAKWKE
jgi:hypothetical protein